MAHLKNDNLAQSPTQSSDPVERLMQALRGGELSAAELREALRIKHRHYLEWGRAKVCS